MNKIILFAILTILIASCDNIKKRDVERDDYLLLDEQIKKNSDAFFIDGNLGFNLFYDKLVKISALGNNLEIAINNKNISKDSIIYFVDCVKKATKCYNLSEKKILKLIKEESYEEAIYEIKFFVYLTSNVLIKNHLAVNTNFDLLKAIAVNEKNTIKLGDTLKTDIYLAGNNSAKKYAVIIENDTLNKYSEFFPRIINIPQKKGVYHKKGRIVYYRPIYGVSPNYDFEYSYKVE